MPLHRVICHNETTKIYLWKITESYDQLFSEVALNEKNQLRLHNMKSEMHRRGFLSVRKLLEYNGYTDFDLYYDETGKPHLHDGRHISISHSHEFSAIIISDKVTGIDLELCRDKAAVIAHRFLHEEEINALDQHSVDYIPKITVLWGIKEVIFKIRNEIGISFKDHVRAESFELPDKQTTAFLEMGHTNLSFRVYFENIGNFMLVYAFETDILPL